jgi:hypothetical protein
MSRGAPQITTGAPFIFVLTTPRKSGGSTHEKTGSGRIFLPSILDARDNPDSEQHDSAEGDPAGRHVSQMSPVNQAAD